MHDVTDSSTLNITKYVHFGHLERNAAELHVCFHCFNFFQPFFCFEKRVVVRSEHMHTFCFLCLC